MSLRYLLVPLAALLASPEARAQAVLPSGLEINLLPGYAHQPLKGIDSIVGKLVKKDGPEILYDIGGVPKPGGLLLGGQYVNQVERLPPKETQWRKKQTIAGRDVHFAYTKDQRLLVSTAFKTVGVNLSAEAKTSEDIAEILLMAMTLNERKDK